jgi:hypothetical protein
MSKLEEIKQQIQDLSGEERAALRDWFWAFDDSMPLDAEPLPELDEPLDADETAANPGQLVADVMAKIRKNL